MQKERNNKCKRGGNHKKPAGYKLICTRSTTSVKPKDQNMINNDEGKSQIFETNWEGMNLGAAIPGISYSSPLDQDFRPTKPGTKLGVRSVISLLHRTAVGVIPTQSFVTYICCVHAAFIVSFSYTLSRVHMYLHPNQSAPNRMLEGKMRGGEQRTGSKKKCLWPAAPQQRLKHTALPRGSGLLLGMIAAS